MSLRRFAHLHGAAFKIVRLPTRDMGGLLARVDRRQRVVFTDAERVDTFEEQCRVLNACRTANEVPPPTG